MKKVLTVFILWLTCFVANSMGLNQRETDKIKVFNHLYGYVKYFHPSDEAAELDWDAFAIYGSKKILDSEDRDFIEVLNELFKPIAPTLTLCYGIPSSKMINPYGKLDQNVAVLDTIQWQHIGNGQLGEKDPYISKRIKWSSKKNFLFDKKLNFDNLIRKEIGLGIFCVLPTVLIIDTEGTYPKAEVNLLDKLIKEMRIIKNSYIHSTNQKEFYIGNLINFWNSIQHFYPYFNEVEINWESSFTEMLLMALKKPNPKNFIKTLTWGLSAIGDGHARVNNVFYERYFPPINIEWIEGKMIITNTDQKNINYIGSEIIAINEVPIREVIKNFTPLVPKSHLHEMMDDIAQEMIASYEYGKRYDIITVKNKIDQPDTLVIHSKTKGLKPKRSLVYQKNIKPFHKIDKYLSYINMDLLTYNLFENHLQEIKNSKALIIDMRGYPDMGNGIFKFLGHFIKENDSTRWMFKPNIIKPDRYDLSSSYSKSGWNIEKLIPAINATVYFLIDNHAQSYSESITGFFAKMDHVTLIGSQTTGINGNINRFRLPGGYTYQYTGMKVLKHDGSRLHGIGFLPDVEVRPTVQGIIDGRDEVLEKAIELAKKEL